ncbi:MAG: hypothetical protein AAFY31_11715, partial [Pseudomonadota bacterium]
KREIEEVGAVSEVFHDIPPEGVVKDELICTDLLDFTLHSTVTSISDLSISAAGADTRVTLAGGGPDQITLVGVTSTDLDASDFMF